MSKWEIFHRVLEAAYLLSGIVITILAAFGLKQITLAKRSLKQSENLARTSAKRESYKLAAEYCDLYLKQTIPVLMVSDETLKAAKMLDLLCNFEVNTSESSISVKPPDNFDHDAFDRLLADINCAKAIVASGNALEAFAVPFTAGVASEMVAFRSVGVTYCHSVRDLLPIFLPIANGKHYENMFTLYHLWQRRLDLRELRKEHAHISKQIAKRQDLGIKPIGV